MEVTRPDIAGYQPAMLDYQEVKSSIQTRAELNKFINKYARYLREGAEEVTKTERGGVLTNWAKNEIKIFDLTENAKRARARKKLGEKEVTIAGQPTGVKRAEMGAIKENDVKPRTHNVKNMSQGDIENLFRLMDKKMRTFYDEEAQHKMLENYVKGLIAEGYSDELIQMFNNISVDEFFEVVDTDETASFDFIYDPIELKAKQDALIELWETHVNEQANNNINFAEIRKTVEYEYANGLRYKGHGRIKTTRKKRRK